MDDRTLGGAWSRLRQRVVLLERRMARRSTGSGVGVPYGVPLPFLGPDALIPDRYIKPMGQTVSRVTYANLFAAYGTYHGAGDGSTTFRLPDLRGVALVGVDPGSAEFGAVGDTFGTKTHTLTTAQIPSHNHGGDTGQSVVSSASFASTGSGNRGLIAASGASTIQSMVGSGHTHSIPSQGGGGAHNNIQPSMACNWILKY